VLHISQAQCTPHAHADQRRAPRHHHTTNTRARRHTRCDKPQPPQRHVSVIARVTQDSAHQQATQATSHTRTQHKTHKPRTPAGRLTQSQPLRTAQASLHAHRRAHATHTTALSSDHPTHRQQKITPSHTRGLRDTLTIVESGCPASTGCCRTVGCFSSSSTCRAHEQPSRHTMPPDAATAPVSCLQRIAAHRIASIK
jgi:hypothetical protein